MSLKNIFIAAGKKRIVLFSIFLILSIMWMMVIFSFSSETSNESTERSDPASTKIAKVINPEYRESEKLGEFMDLYVAVSQFVRKSAHIIAYALLGALTYFATGAIWVNANVVKPIVVSIG